MALGWPRGDVDNELDPTFSLFLGITVLGYLPPSSFVQDRYPGLQVEGGNFPPPPLRSMTAQTLSALKFILIIVLVSGQNPFALLNVATPEAYNWAIENKVYACMMVFFVSNMIETQLVSTGECWINMVVNRDVEAVDFNAASTASASASILQFKY